MTESNNFTKKFKLLSETDDANSTFSKLQKINKITKISSTVSTNNIKKFSNEFLNRSDYSQIPNVEDFKNIDNIQANLQINKRDEMLSPVFATEANDNFKPIDSNFMEQDKNFNPEIIFYHKNEDNRDNISLETILDEKSVSPMIDVNNINDIEMENLPIPMETEVIEYENFKSFKNTDNDKLQNNSETCKKKEKKNNFDGIIRETMRFSDSLTTEIQTENNPNISIKPKVLINDVKQVDNTEVICQELEVKEKFDSTVKDLENVSDKNHFQEQLTIEEELKDCQYRQSFQVFRQHLPCFKLQYTKNVFGSKTKISKCRECRVRPPQLSSNDIYCRFLDFRCLQYTEDGILNFTGFPNPYTDFTADDQNIWQPDDDTEPTSGSMPVQICRYILMYIGDQFCDLWRQESEALKLNENSDKPIAWKKLVQGIREICDVCDTTLFNFHWTCEICGFGVCLDCYKDYKLNIAIKRNALRKGCDENFWLLCSSGLSHKLSDLRLTQIIAGDSLNVLGRKLHEIRTIWQIPQQCHCLLSTQKIVQKSTKKLVNNFIKDQEIKDYLNSVKMMNSVDKQKQNYLNKFHEHKINFTNSMGLHYAPGPKFKRKPPFEDHISNLYDNLNNRDNNLKEDHLQAHYLQNLPAQVMSLQQSILISPDVPHEWLCDGKLLRLLDPRNYNNRILFQEVWKRGQPVMISEVSKSLTLSLWHPQTFLRDFGDKPNDLINCLTGNLVPNQPMRHFWEGFLSINKRLMDANGEPMLLKLKDWPPGDDFAEILPNRFNDLMKGLPMSEYTLRIGELNLASCLPKMFVPPDLGPKMYNAYGSALYPEKGTTNLHLDISDAVNIMVYVGMPYDDEITLQHEASQIAITKGGCEYLTRARIARKDIIPGALWHIFHARDADKIRDFLNKETLEKGFRLEADHDPIHDQNWYLDENLRKRLFQEYGVEGYPIVQCLGDAVFIPAGAPHQVQNLYNCIKVAEDFVSPENISHCFHLTQQFRRLSHSHTNHEDKLQIKNIIYHAVKDCCTILNRISSKRCSKQKFKRYC